MPIGISFAAISYLISLLDFLPALSRWSRDERRYLDRIRVIIRSKDGGGGL